MPDGLGSACGEDCSPSPLEGYACGVGGDVNGMSSVCQGFLKIGGDLGGMESEAAHGRDVDGHGEEDDHDGHEHERGRERVVLGADSLEDEVLEGGEEGDGLGGE